MPEAANAPQEQNALPCAEQGAEEREREALRNKRRGHRQRRRRSVLKYGAFVLTDNELLEMLLYYVMLRVDTDGEDITRVSGLQANAEVFFMLLRQVSLRDTGAKGVGDFRKPETAAEYLFRLYAGIKRETVCAMYLDEDGGMLDSSFVFRGDVNSARFSLRAVTEGVLRNRGRGVIIAHNHPSGFAIPSREDDVFTKSLYSALEGVGVRFLDHIIIAGEDYVSLADTGILSLYRF